MNNKKLKELSNYPTDFFDLDKDKSDSKIHKLVGNTIIFNYKEDDGSILYIGKLLKYENKYLTVQLIEENLLEMNFNINDIIDIEKSYDLHCIFKNEFKNNLCEITNQHNQEIVVFIKSYDGTMICFDFVQPNGELAGCEYFWPLCLIKDIKIVNNI